MKKLILLIILLFTFSSTTYANVFDKTGKEITMTKTTDGYMMFNDQLNTNIENLKKHTVILTTIEEDGQYGGAGIAIDKRHILTANHVATTGSRVFYSESEDSEPYWATVIKTDPAHDLSLLEIDKNATDLITEPMTFAKDITLNETVYTIGHPKSHYYSLTNGKVSWMNGKGYEGIQSIELNMRIKSGNSGGFVINTEGEIVGMMFSAGPAENMGQMIGKDDIMEFIRS